MRSFIQVVPHCFYPPSVFYRFLALLLAFWLCLPTFFAQNVGINTTSPDASAALDVTATDKGILVPRLTTSQKNAISSPATGLLVFDTTVGQFYFYNGTTWTTLMGTLTSGYLSKMGNAKLTNSTLYDNGTFVGIGTTSPSSRLDIQNSSNTDISIKSTGGAASVHTTSPSGSEAVYFLNTVNATNTLTTKRWGIGKANSSETGNNAGGDFVLNRYNDVGTYLGQPLLIKRDYGGIVLGNDGVHSTFTTVSLNGSVGIKVKTVTTSNTTTTLDGTDYMVVFDGTLTNNTLTIPHPAGCQGRIYFIINHSTSAVSLNFSYSYRTANNAISTSIGVNEKVQLVSDGSNWHKMN
jgi:hypothetical protein